MKNFLTGLFKNSKGIAEVSKQAVEPVKKGIAEVSKQTVEPVKDILTTTEKRIKGKVREIVKTVVTDANGTVKRTSSLSKRPLPNGTTKITTITRTQDGLNKLEFIENGFGPIKGTEKYTHMERVQVAPGKYQWQGSTFNPLAVQEGADVRKIQTQISDKIPLRNTNTFILPNYGKRLSVY